MFSFFAKKSEKKSKHKKYSHKTTLTQKQNMSKKTIESHDVLWQVPRP